MSTPITMPQMGADMTEGTVLKWLKKVGDEVKRGEIIAEIETDKATVELEAFEGGVLQQLVVEEGETVPVGETIAILGEAGEKVEAPERKPPAETPARRKLSEDRPEEEEAQAASRQPLGTEEATAEREPDGRVRISPVARRIANEQGVDIGSLQGSGPGGRILRRDVEAAAKGAPSRPVETEEKAPAASPAPVARPTQTLDAVAGKVQPLTRMRQAIARRMSQSKQAAPHYYLTLDIDMTAALEFRRQLNSVASDEERVSINDLVVKACALALYRHPRFNSEFGEEGIRIHDQINVDVGIALDDGLIAPAILDAGRKSLGQIAREGKDLVSRAREGRLRADEYSAGTFTITNLGAFGVESLIGIINPPQAAILGVGSVMKQPVVLDDAVVARDVMKVALSADHRVTDGAEGARFLKEIQGFLENPAAMAL